MIEPLNFEELKANPTNDGLDHLATILGVLLAKVNELIEVVNALETDPEEEEGEGESE